MAADRREAGVVPRAVRDLASHHPCSSDSDSTCGARKRSGSRDSRHDEQRECRHCGSSAGRANGRWYLVLRQNSCHFTCRRPREASAIGGYYRCRRTESRRDCERRCPFGTPRRQSSLAGSRPEATSSIPPPTSRPLRRLCSGQCKSRLRYQLSWTLARPSPRGAGCSCPGRPTTG